MKKILAAIAVCFAMATSASAQDNAIGLRGGFNGLDISYQKMMGKSNRLQLDLGFPRFHGISASGTYQWMFPIPSFPSGFAWYAGAGAYLGIHFVGAFNLGVHGNVGIEYTLPSFPLQFAIDYTPSLGLTMGDGYAHFADGFWNFAGAVRYKF